jgi:hypothetical protein
MPEYVRPFGKYEPPSKVATIDGVVHSGWMGNTPPVTEVPPLLDLPPTLEDAHVALLDELADGAPYDIIQLGDDQLGLMVDGELRATYRKETLYPKGSTVARILVETAEREARKARNAVRSYGRAIRGSTKIRPSVEKKSTQRETSAINSNGELDGMDKFLGKPAEETEEVKDVIVEEVTPEPEEDELSGIEHFIGKVLVATPAERASIRDRRPVGRDLLGMIPESQGISREKVEGID